MSIVTNIVCRCIQFPDRLEFQFWLLPLIEGEYKDYFTALSQWWLCSCLQDVYKVWESECSCSLCQADYLCPVYLKKREGLDSDDALPSVCCEGLQRDIKYRCQFQISLFAVSALVVSWMRRYSGVHQAQSCTPEEGFTQLVYIVVFTACLNLLNCNHPDKMHCFLQGLFHCDKLLIVAVVADPHLGFWFSGAIKLEKLMVHRSVG